MATCKLPGCDKEVVGRAQTCSAAHRQAWSRLRKRVAYEKAGLGETKPEDAATAAEGADPVELAIEVYKQELTPHVREAITEDVIKSIRALVTLTPQLIESLGRDLGNADPVARGRAQALLAKYTLGQVDPEKQDSTRPLVINMGNMPTPGEPVPDTIVESGIAQQCDRCEESKSINHFEHGATRCNECQAEIRSAIEAEYS